MSSDTDPRPQTPGERRLAHPPSDRYRVQKVEADAPVRATSAGRGLAYGLAATTAGALAIVVLGGVLAISAGLLVVAAATGWAIAAGLRVGGGAALSPGRRWRFAIVLATVAMVLGQVGLWLYARSEGGVLGVFDYLGETFGALVPLEIVVATALARLSAR